MEKLKLKLKVYSEALKSFKDLLTASIDALDPVLIDGIKNGRIQKFEYTTELTWKLVKRFLYIVDGVETKSPKEAIKEYFLKGHCTENDYQALIAMIDDRNLLSHIYDAQDFEDIHNLLGKYLTLMEQILAVISKKST